jgi:hypothetical protein
MRFHSELNFGLMAFLANRTPRFLSLMILARIVIQ